MKAALYCLFVTLLFVSTACDDNMVKPVSDQEVYFEVSYTNFAWGEQFRGFLIDKDGKIKTYDKPAQWNKVTEKSGLSVAQLKENLSNSVNTDKSVSMAELKENISKISSIGNSFSKPVAKGADQGQTLFYAYRYDAEKLIYTPILLSQTGDVESHNTDAAAIELSAWLAGVLAKVY
ncbi:hypothetical protein [Dyadobacter psychrotolerans]|uniref:DUF1795 domain-containing protein n=1 Tax=Dyadobacter psychrotolerans TaxID=2541721 RepID=A0A4R5DJ51_9BACT|nr:hypothetical protein [Dyadobacter psychrotolerans]TDE11981.1 hypothetical protein E0F88_23280 [Dyadobacter psychrotolerans]